MQEAVVDVGRPQVALLDVVNLCKKLVVKLVDRMRRRRLLLPPTLPRVPPPQVAVDDPLLFLTRSLVKPPFSRPLSLPTHPPPCRTSSLLLLAVLGFSGHNDPVDCRLHPLGLGVEHNGGVALLPLILTASHICLIKELLKVLATLNLKAILSPTLAG